MAELLERVRSAVRSLGNDGAVANIRSDMAAAAHMRQEVERLERRMALVLLPVPPAAGAGRAA
jgi:hypothetical protein